MNFLVLVHKKKITHTHNVCSSQRPIPEYDFLEVFQRMMQTIYKIKRETLKTSKIIIGKVYFLYTELLVTFWADCISTIYSGLA